MPGIESNAVEPTKDELRGLSVMQKALRLAPTYGLVILMFGLIVLFSILLPNTFPTMLNLRVDPVRQGDHRASVAGGDDPDGGGPDRPDGRLRHRAVAHPGDQPADDLRPALAGGGRDRAGPGRHHRCAERPAGRGRADRQLHRHAWHRHRALRAGAVAHRRAADGRHLAGRVSWPSTAPSSSACRSRPITCWRSPWPCGSSSNTRPSAATFTPSAPTSVRRS